MIDILIIVAGLGGLIFGTRFVVDGSVAVAKRFGISEFVIGVTILSIGSDLPELAIAVDAAVRNLSTDDVSGVIVGTAFGSALGQIGFVLGLTGLFGYLTLPKRIVYRHGGVLLGSIVVLALAGVDGQVTRTEAGSLLILFALYCVSLLLDKQTFSVPTDEAADSKSAPSLMRIVGGLILVVYSSELCIDSVIRLGETFGVNQLLVSILALGLGSSLPELSISLAALARKHGSLSVGNIIGSNIFDTLVPVGVAGLIAPLAFEKSVLMVEVPALAVVSILALLFFLRRRGLQKPEAATLLFVYLAYLTGRVIFEFS